MSQSTNSTLYTFAAIMAEHPEDFAWLAANSDFRADDYDADEEYTLHKADNGASRVYVSLDGQTRITISQGEPIIEVK